jgi:hypothetical protein
MSRRRLLPLLVLLLLARPAAAQPANEPLVDRVKNSIARGIGYLRAAEGGAGNWDHQAPAESRFKGGPTALVMLALLTSGVKSDDPVIERGLKYLRSVEPRDTYVVALQTMVFAEAGRPEDRQRIQRNVDWLIEARVIEDGKLRGWTYITGTRGGDNSNTQYALLGLHAGHVAGAKIDEAVWRSIRDFYITTQEGDGGWVYNRSYGGGSMLTMTSAGLCGLLIAGLEAETGRAALNLDDGTARDCGLYNETEAVSRALRWVSTRFTVELPSNTFYSLYGLERAGRLSGQRFFGPHDWYRAGCKYLTDRQDDNGGWSERQGRGTSPIISTSFALLFLSKGRVPVLVSKLVHGPGEDWNNKHNDCRHLVEYASREVFNKLPLAWQVFDVSRQEVGLNRDRLRELVGDLLQSPVVYFNGHQAPRFSDLEKQLLKDYLDQGGFLLAEACCGRKEFDAGFRKLMKELFPDNDLKLLAPEHPIWRAHAVIPPNQFTLEGIEMGCKTVVVYSPQPLAGYWEANLHTHEQRGKPAFRLAGNIIAYATGLEAPKPRLTETDLVKPDPDGKKVPRGVLKVAQLRHEGDWQPAPRAMRNLLAHLRDKAGLFVSLQTEPLRADHPDLTEFKFLYMHGRSAFSFSADQVKNLRNDLETGGVLFADACCGRKAFDESFRALAAQLFPDKKLEPIPPGDDLYSRDLNGTEIATVRCRTETAGGPAEFREIPPRLEGIKLNGRWAVIYSKYDVGCALEKHQSTDCLGHDHASALRIGGAAVLYALKR